MKHSPASNTAACWIAAAALPQMSRSPQSLVESWWTRRQTGRPLWHSITDRSPTASSYVASLGRKVWYAGFRPA